MQLSDSPKYSGQGSPSTSIFAIFVLIQVKSNTLIHKIKYFSDFRINSIEFDYFGIYLFIEKIQVFLLFSY